MTTAVHTEKQSGNYQRVLDAIRSCVIKARHITRRGLEQELSGIKPEEIDSTLIVLKEIGILNSRSRGSYEIKDLEPLRILLYLGSNPNIKYAPKNIAATLHGNEQTIRKHLREMSKTYTPIYPENPSLPENSNEDRYYFNPTFW